MSGTPPSCSAVRVRGEHLLEALRQRIRSRRLYSRSTYARRYFETARMNTSHGACRCPNTQIAGLQPISCWTAAACRHGSHRSLIKLRGNVFTLPWNRRPLSRPSIHSVLEDNPLGWSVRMSEGGSVRVSAKAAGINLAQRATTGTLKLRDKIFLMSTHYSTACIRHSGL